MSVAPETSHDTGASAGATPADPRSRNIVLLCNSLDELGGVQRVAHLLARGFVDRGHEVQVIGILHAEERYDYEPEGYETWTLYDEAFEPRPFHPRRLRDELRVASWGRELYRRKVRADAVKRLSQRLSTLPPGSIVICMQVWAMEWLARADTSHLRVIVQSHEDFDASRGLTPASAGSSRYRRIRRLYGDADMFLTLTHDDARRFEQDGFDNMGVMYNPLTMTVGEPAPLTERTVVNVARYHVQKNQLDLIEAWALVAAKHPDWTLKMFGEGPLEEEMRELIAQHGLESSALICGTTTQVREELMRSSVFALSSDFEGLPVVVAEAMTCGVPCVSYDCGPGIRELITDGVDGLVTPAHDPKGLAEGLCRLIEDEELRRRLGAAAQESVRRFEPERVFADWERLFAYVER